jgi:methionine sulfoxide reductase heme-binding subunit
VSEPSPLWFAARGLGMVLLLTLTGTVVIGILTSRRWSAEDWPRFVTADLHRNLSLLAVVLLGLHGGSVVLDTFAGLGLRDVLIPFATAYRPLWLGMGVLAGELLVALVVVSLLRARLGYGVWRFTHWAAYAAWPLALLHGLGTGSDTRFGWALLVYVACMGAVLTAVLVRLSLHRPAPSSSRVLAGLAIGVAALGVAIWTMLGPLQPGWAAAAGTPPSLLGPSAASPSPTPNGGP